MSELEQLRQEAEQLKNQIRVSGTDDVACEECGASGRHSVGRRGRLPR